MGERRKLRNLLRVDNAGQIEGVKDGWADINSIFKRKHVQRIFKEELIKQGFTEATLAKNFIALTKAQKVVTCNHMGVITYSKKLDDNPIIMEANKNLARLMEAEPDKNINMDHSGAVGSYDALEILDDAELTNIILECEENPEEQDNS